MSNPQSPRVYFPGLNALRFFAASAVVFGHIEQVKDFWHLPHSSNAFIKTSGGMAVSFFFVLSGFLITYLLFKEKETYQTVDVKKFYIRRIMRVWPLYYLIVLLAFLVLPNLPMFYIPGLSNEVGEKLPYNALFYLALMPNVANVFNMLVVYANQLWSIGVEEQFYVFWPWLLKKQQRYALVFWLIVIGFVVARNGFAFVSSHTGNQQLASICSLLNSFLLMTRIDCMAIGGLFSLYIFQNNESFKRFFINRTMEILSLLCIIGLAFSGIYLPYIHHDLYAVVFGIFIINTSCNPKSLFCLEGSVWTTLGNISYGIYMYHLIAIGTMLAVFRALNITNFSLPLNLVLHISTLLLTIIIAQLSYRFFETPFLVFKAKMTQVKSGSM